MSKHNVLKFSIFILKKLWLKVMHISTSSMHIAIGGTYKEFKDKAMKNTSIR